MNKRILIAGEGGQGIQIIAKILTRTLFGLGKKVTYLPNFGVEQRGGVSLAYVQVSSEEIGFPKFKTADFVVILAPRAIGRVKEYIGKESVILFDNSLISEDLLSSLKLEKIAIPASYYAKKKLVPKSFNMIVLGAIIEELGVSKIDSVEKEVNNFFFDKYKKEPQLKHFNQRALEVGFEIGSELKKEKQWREKTLK